MNLIDKHTRDLSKFTPEQMEVLIDRTTDSLVNEGLLNEFGVGDDRTFELTESGVIALAETLDGLLEEMLSGAVDGKRYEIASSREEALAYLIKHLHSIEPIYMVLIRTRLKTVVLC